MLRRRGVREPGPKIITFGVKKLVCRKPRMRGTGGGEPLQQIRSALSMPNNRTNRTLLRIAIASALMILFPRKPYSPRIHAMGVR
jgi:hypothetical protein